MKLNSYPLIYPPILKINNIVMTKKINVSKIRFNRNEKKGTKIFDE